MTLYNNNGTLVIGDPEGYYDYDKLCKEWADKMGQLPNLPGPKLEDMQRTLCEQVNTLYEPTGEKGFDYQGVIVQGDSKAQANLTSYVVAYMAGLLTFPLPWRLRDNTSRPISANEFMDFAQAMTAFRASLFASFTAVKDEIKNSETVEQAQEIFDTWKSSL